MGICESNKNQNLAGNAAQNVPVNNTNTNPSVPQSAVVQNGQKLQQNINANTQLITNNTNAIVGEQQKKVNNQDNEGISFDRNVSMGSSLNNEDSIGYNQTRNTVAV